MKFVKLTYALIAQEGYSLSEKLVWAYMQGFPKCFASDAAIAAALSMPVGSVKQAKHRIRKKSGLKGRNWPKSDTIPSKSYNVVTKSYSVVTPKLQPSNSKEAILPMKTEPLLDSILDRVLDKGQKGKMLKNPMHILNSIEAKENQRRKRAAAEIDIKRQEYLRTA